MQRLSTTTLSTLPDKVVRPAFDRTQAIGVVHLGTGAFHRAHQAHYMQALMEAGHDGWMIRGSSLRSGQVAEQLNPQDGLYTILVRDGDREEARICGAIHDVLVAPDNPAALVAALAEENVDLVTLTVTEKGYCVDVASGQLRLSDPDIQHDIANIATPRTAPGFLVAGLMARRERGLAPFTVLSCDNLSHNGERVRTAVLDLAAEIDPALADWISEHGAFPSSMVDRIVPATTEADIEALETHFGYHDAAMVKAEPFTQWVVEDSFAGRRPPLETVGVQMTNDVAGWESVKLRMLNASHSLMCYLGALAGHDYIHEVMAAEGFENVVDTLWDEVEPTLPAIEGFDPKSYRQALKARFSNSALQHRTVQIAMDGSQKIPQRLVAAYLERHRRGLSSPAHALAIAGWMRWQYGTDEQGQPYRVDDPLAEKTAAALEGNRGEAEATVQALTALSAIFDPIMTQDAALQQELSSALKGLLDNGAAATVAHFQSA
ncbi:mannitol dehydrogenase family protein [Parvularcula sp. LCG005]|uniref:mannitol dehydrogenase family protein n=1 Tax=Parvularcula sp. LCG005 TaxID=3078805 RepID=UPI002941BD9B|nr:mannitol dehydrogenase family protein [Parvularcula sp. LCG005]WOI53476.1 mannitol dehydrogenase family protein [Parvularcula sp. LCG005]